MGVTIQVLAILGTAAALLALAARAQLAPLPARVRRRK
jgi:hypothetical protein